MKSTFYATILALALSVSAAPVSSSSRRVDEPYGAPTFAGDTEHPYTPPEGLDPKESSPSANQSEEPSVSNNSTTPAAPFTSSNSTSTGTNTTGTNTTSFAHIDKRKVYAPSRLIRRVDEPYGAPTFAGDTEHPYTPPEGLDPKESSPSANQSDEPSVSNNSTTPAAPFTSSNSTSTSNTTSFAHIDKRKVYAPSRLVTPDVKSYVSKSGHTMFGMQNPVCSDVTLIFARGTTEVGNMGTCVGPELADELRDLMPSLSVQGVDYPANSKGDTTYGASGGPYMAMLAREARKQCPDTKIVLAGYSQGARCIHGALGESEKPFDGSDVAAVVAFGDPLNGKNNFKGIDRDDVLQVCGDSDDRCQHGQVDMTVHGGHISYGASAKDVAKWIKKTVG